MSTPRAKGFTLIELLVVIAVIGVLSSVVLSSLNNARSKGGDTGSRANLAQARTQALLFYEVNANSYTNVCTNTSIGAIRSIYDHVQAATVASGLISFTRNLVTGGATGVAVCNDGPTGWAAQVPLKTNLAQFVCVDSEGSVVTTSTNLLADATDYKC